MTSAEHDTIDAAAARSHYKESRSHILIASVAFSGYQEGYIIQ